MRRLYHVASCNSSSLSLLQCILFSFSCFGINDCSSLVSESVERMLSMLSDVITLFLHFAPALLLLSLSAVETGCSSCLSTSTCSMLQVGAVGVSGGKEKLGGSWCGWYSTCACAGWTPIISTPPTAPSSIWLLVRPCNMSLGPTDVLAPSKSMWTLSLLPCICNYIKFVKIWPDVTRQDPQWRHRKYLCSPKTSKREYST